MPFTDPERRRAYQRRYYKTNARAKKGRRASHTRWRARRRARIFERDQYECYYCREKKDVDDLHVDHKIPRVLGGSNADSNLLTACGSCNQRRFTRFVCEHCRSWLGATRLDRRTVRCDHCQKTNDVPKTLKYRNIVDPNAVPEWVEDNHDAADQQESHVGE